MQQQMKRRIETGQRGGVEIQAFWVKCKIVDKTAVPGIDLVCRDLAGEDLGRIENPTIRRDLARGIAAAPDHRPETV